MSTMGQGFIDFDPVSGQPFAGMEITPPGMAVRLYLCDKTNAEAFRKGISELIDTLIKTKPKLVVPNGR